MPTERLNYCSDGGALAADDARKLALWCEEYFDSYGGVEIAVDWESPCAIDLQYLALGAFGLRVERASFITRFHRPADRVARDGDDRLTLIVNRGQSATQRVTPSQTVTLDVGSSILFDRAQASAHVCPGGSDRLVLIMPRRPIGEALANFEDLVGRPIAPGNQALRLMTSFAEGLLYEDAISEPAVLAEAGRSLMDLVVLAYGSDRDNSEIARMRGLRAARLSAALSIIRSEYSDPQIAPESVARRIGISTRTLHLLLQETDASFSQRVKDLRLAKAFALLNGAKGRVRTVSDAAFEAGFSDLSYFVRSFRRKYGMTPSAARGRGLAADTTG